MKLDYAALWEMVWVPKDMYRPATGHARRYSNGTVINPPVTTARGKRRNAKKG